MNKKFSTLVASMLLAGGLFTTVDAQIVKTDEYVRIVRTHNFDATNKYSKAEHYDLAVVDSKAGVLPADETPTDAALWKVSERTVTINGQSGSLFSFVNKAGDKLKVSYTFPNGETKVVEEFQKTDNAKEGRSDLFFYDGKTKVFLGQDANVDGTPFWTIKGIATGQQTANNPSYGFTNKAVAANVMQAADLNNYLGNDKGFKLSIGYLKDNKEDKYTVYDNLEGNPFVGTLYADNMILKYKDNKGSVQSVNKTSTPSYMLRQGGKDGKIIVLLNDNYNKQNSDVIQGVNGFKFAAYSLEDLQLQLAKDALQSDAAKKAIKAVYFTVASSVNSDNLEVAIENTELIVSVFGTQTVLTTAAQNAAGADYANATNKTYVRFGSGNLVDMTKFANGQYFYTFENKDKEVAGAVCYTQNNQFANFFQPAKDVQIDMPEGQWSLNYTGGDNITFVNRESKQSFTINAKTFYTTSEANVYEIGSELFTINKIAVADAKDGYADFGKTTQKSFNIGLYSSVWDKLAYLTENHSAKKHQIGLEADVENATAWRLEAQDKAETYSKIDGSIQTKTDSVYVVSTVNYWGKKDNKDQWLEAKDTLKIVSYTIKNASNGEYVGYNANENYYECNEDAVRFAFKQVGESYNMVEVYAPTTTYDARLGNRKVYGGDAAVKGLLARVGCMYDRTENDLFKVESANSALYRRLANEIDTISIFRDENASQLLFEDGKFLGLKNENQFEFAPAMLSVAAYAPVDTDRPQYMLAVDATDIAEADTVWCNATSTHKHETLADSLACPHTSITSAYMKARFLVNLKDSAIAFEKTAPVHAVNPYVNTEKYYRLGFVPATYTKDSLIVASSNDSIYVGNENFNQAKFAFKYVDQAAGSFKIETADYNKLDADKAGEMKETTGWIKWMNGVVVVVDSEKDADIFNMNEEETRKPTANEGVEVSEVSVVAANGAVIVKGAEGKKVAVSNILGQTIANTVVSSDNATIAVPAGIVVVAVEGEDAVKVVVK